MIVNTKKLIKELRKKVNYHEDHWWNLKNIISLKESFGYCKAYCIPQTYGVLLQKKITQLYGWTPVEASLLKGDLDTKKNLIELKISLGGALNNNFNFVQLRQSQAFDFYVFIAYVINKHNYRSLGELFIFKLNKQDVLPFLVSSFSHGTKKEWLQIKNADSIQFAEKDIRVVYGSKKWGDLLRHRISMEEFEDL